MGHDAPIYQDRGLKTKASLRSFMRVVHMLVRIIVIFLVEMLHSCHLNGALQLPGALRLNGKKALTQRASH